MCSSRVISLENSLSYKDVFWNLKQSFLLILKHLNTYNDTIEASKPTDLFTNINTKLSGVAEKFEAENKHKLKEEKPFNITVFNISE